MVPGSEFAKRMKNSFEGLSWVTDRRATLNNLTVHHYIALSDGNYLCDVTYVVDTHDYSGQIQTTASATLVLTAASGQLLIEAMISGTL